MYQIKGAQGYFAISMYPVTQIFNEFRVKYSYPLASGRSVLSFIFSFGQDRVPDGDFLPKKGTTPGAVRG